MVVAEVTPFPVPVRRVTVRLIQKVVARRNGMTTDQLLQRTRRKAVSRPRQMAMYLACALTSLSLPDIGERFGGFDHTTVMHARNRIKLLARQDPALAFEIMCCQRDILRRAEGP